MRRPNSVPIALLVVAALQVSLGDVSAEKQRSRSGFNVPPVYEWTSTADINAVQRDRDTRDPAKAVFDTIWIADWTFDAPSGLCDTTGWMTEGPSDLGGKGIDPLFWRVEPDFDGAGAITGRAATIGSSDPCCVNVDGYDNNWYQAIRIEYQGSGTLSFDYLIDSEEGFDFLQVETDSACASFDLADDATLASEFRTLLFSDSGYDLSGGVSNLSVPDHGTSDTHCLYLAFFSDGAFSPCDGLQETQLGRALVVDNIVLNTATTSIAEDFEESLDPLITFVNIENLLVGTVWARPFVNPPDLDPDACTENTTCVWIFTDPSLRPPPGVNDEVGALPAWIDNAIISPWVSLAAAPSATGTVVTFREFPGNFFSTSRAVRNVSVRTRTPLPAPTASPSEAVMDCVSAWGGSFQFNSLGIFQWRDVAKDMTDHVGGEANAVQVRYRVSDWQVIVGAPPPVPHAPHPGPFVDRIRIGRLQVNGPVFDEGIDSRSQAQDAFPTEIDPAIPAGAGEHFRPTTDIFGSCAFSNGADIGRFLSPKLITGDSIFVTVRDARDAGGIASVVWYGAIVRGVHAGKAPPPWTVGSNGFFQVSPDSARDTAGQVVDGRFYVDLDDDYFRGGDMLHYFWLASDGSGAVSTLPEGLNGVPNSIAEAQAGTQGLFEVSFLPAIDWSPSYVARVEADSHGKLDPTPEEITQSSQLHCVLYAQQVNPRRRAGNLHRTSFMYALAVDLLGSGFDVYDHQGLGNTNNHLGGRATIEQAAGYSLILYDAGNRQPDGTIMPDGSDVDAEKIDQAGWFRSWLAQANASDFGWVTLWIVGANALEEKPTNALYTTDMGVSLASVNQRVDINPEVVGQTSVTFVRGGGSSTVDLTVGPKSVFTLEGGCPDIRDYDGLARTGSGTIAYRYRSWPDGFLGDAALVVNSNAAAGFNTIVQSHGWDDIRDVRDASPTYPTAGQDLARAVVAAVAPTACLETDAGVTDARTPPLVTQLFTNVPNPFNPSTRIRFDLARDGRVQLRIFDVAGRRVRTLVREERSAGRYTEVWNGLDDTGERASSGVYFYRLDATDFTATRKLVLLK